MSKPKALLKQAKGKKKEPALNTSDDFLAAGVEHEEAAGKWRAGDAAKSLRFFQRAVEKYDQGLRDFPRSLDLAYNKARVQLEVTTHPLFVPQLQVPHLDALRETLSSHRYALSIDSNDANTLFNTAQVLTAIAEELSKQGDEATSEILKLVEEALELQGKCLSLQELKFDESERQRAAIQLTEPEDAIPLQEAAEDDDVEAAESIWFSVEEPTTLDTLIDTALAQLATLTTLCSILSSAMTTPSSPGLAWIEEFSSAILSDKLSVYVRASDPPRLQEVALIKSTFVSAFLEASFHQHAIDVETYKRQRDSAFQAQELQLEQYPDGLIRNAESLMTFASALSAHPNGPQDQHGAARWLALNAAITTLASASKLKDVDRDSLSKTHSLRGECSLLQWQLSLPPTRFQFAVDNSNQLLKNAEVFYRNASRLSQDDGEKAVSAFRSSIAILLRDSNSEEAGTLLMTYAKRADWIEEQIADMVDEDLIPSYFGESLISATVETVQDKRPA